MLESEEVSVRGLHRDICEAERRIREAIVRTRLVESPQFSAEYDCSLHLKMEQEQRTGSFKLRGAHNKLALIAGREEEETKPASIVTASTGNHGLACLDAMKQHGVAGKIVVPENIAEVKREKLLSLGADLVYHGTDCELTELEGRRLARETGNAMEFISPYNDLEVIAGQGTLGVEILEQLPSLEYLFISVGGGGLISGVAAYVKTVKPEVVVVGCQPAASPVMSESVKAGQIVDLLSSDTLSDGTAGGVERGAVTFNLCRDLVDLWQVVGEDDIQVGIFIFLLRNRKHLTFPHSVGGQVPTQPSRGGGGGLGRAGPGRRQEDEGHHQGQDGLRPSLRGKHRPRQAPESRLLVLGIKINQYLQS